jgi:hypothetical protein
VNQGEARCVRRCLLQGFFPSDRTASISLLNDSRKLDLRKKRAEVPTVDSSPRFTPFLSAEYLRERNGQLIVHHV